MIWTLLAAALIAWLFYAVMENGPTLPGLAIVALVVWALIDYA